MAKDGRISSSWFDDEDAWRFVLVRYLLALGPLNLLWEIAQLPLYTLWTQASPMFIAYAVIHCTLGDLLIGALALIGALTVTRAGPIDQWRWRRIGACTVGLGLVYTGFSEWFNTSVRMSWSYSEWMPLTPLVPLGLSPLLQWLLLPAIALVLARRSLHKAD